MELHIQHSKTTSLFLLSVLAIGVADLHAASLSATSTFTDTLVSPGEYQYDLTLNNTGTTTIGTFWFSWIPGAGFMGVSPTSVMSPAGWTDTITNTGPSIQWLAAAPICPGPSLTGVLLDITMTPAHFMCR